MAAVIAYLYTWAVQWSNPYTQPPDGRPRTLMEVTTETNRCPDEIAAAAGKPGNGWTISFQRINPRAGRASIRRKNLERRVMRTVPLFAEQAIEEAFAAQPDYFSGAKRV